VESARDAAEAANGREGHDALSREEFDLVLLAVHMPVMDGVETTRRIHESSSAWRGLPVIAPTAVPIAGDCERLLATGMSGYVSKPIDQTQLLSAIAAVLGGAAATVGASAAQGRSGVDIGDILADLDRLAG